MVPIDLSGTSREDCATKDGLAVKWVATANNRTGFGGRWEKTRKASSAGSYAMSSSEALLRGKGHTSLPPHPEKTSGSFPGPTRHSDSHCGTAVTTYRAGELEAAPYQLIFEILEELRIYREILYMRCV